MRDAALTRHAPELHRQHHLADVRAAFQMRVRGRGLRERKAAVHDGAHLSLFSIEVSAEVSDLK